MRCNVRIRYEIRKQEALPLLHVQWPSRYWIRAVGSALMLLTPLDTFQIDALLHHFPQWTHFSQSIHMLDAQVDSKIDFLLGRESTNPKADRRVSELLVDADRAQHVRRFQ